MGIQAGPERRKLIRTSKRGKEKRITGKAQPMKRNAVPYVY